ncbi:MAG: hypothetical protein ACO3JL_02920 [Myxococcota bacterium]
MRCAHPHRLLIALLLCTFPWLQGCVDETNPFDPANASPPAGTLVGRIVLPPCLSTRDAPLALQVVDENGVPVRDVTTRTSDEVVPPGLDDAALAVDDSARGTFEVELPPGTYALRFLASTNGLPSLADFTSRDLRIWPTVATSSLFSIDLADDGSFRGAVRVEIEGVSSGAPLDLTLSSVSDACFTPRAVTTTSDGPVDIASVPEGTYEVKSAGDTYVPASTEMEVNREASLQTPAQASLKVVTLGNFFRALPDEGAESPFVRGFSVQVEVAPLVLANVEKVEVRFVAVAPGAAAAADDASWQEWVPPVGDQPDLFTVPLDESRGDGPQDIVAQLRLWIDGVAYPSRESRLAVVVDQAPPTLVDLRLEAVLGDDVVAAPGEAPGPKVLLGCSAFLGAACPPISSSTSVEGFVTLLDETGYVMGYGVTLDDETEPTTYDQLFSSNGLAAFPIDSPAITSEVQGVRLLRLWAQDAAGNRAVVATRQILVDTVPPVAPTLSVANGAATVLSSSIDVIVTSDDNDVAEIAFARDDETPTDFTPADTDADGSLLHTEFITLKPGDGIRAVKARLRDGVGNESTEGSDAVIVDSAVGLEVVSGGLLVPAPALTNDESAQVRLSGAAVVVGRFWVGDTVSEYPTTATTSVSVGDLVENDGEAVVYAQARDAAGNESPILSVPVTLDRMAPTITAVVLEPEPGISKAFLGRPATAFVSPRLRIALSADDGRAAEMVVETFDAPPLATLFDDVAADELTECRPDGLPCDEQCFRCLLEYSDFVSATLAAATAEPYASTTTVLLPSGDGDKYACVQVADAAGNRSSIKCDGIRLDTEPPEAPSIEPIRGRLRTRRGTLHFTALARDPRPEGSPPATVRDYEVTSPGEPPRIFADVSVGDAPGFSLQAGTDNEVCVRAIDDAGNRGTPVCATFAEESVRTVIGNGIDSRHSDLSGDFIAYSGRGGVWLHDMTKGAPETYDDEVTLAPLMSNVNLDDRIFFGTRLSQLRFAGDPERMTLAVGPSAHHTGSAVVYLRTLQRTTSTQSSYDCAATPIDGGDQNRGYQMDPVATFRTPPAESAASANYPSYDLVLRFDVAEPSYSEQASLSCAAFGAFDAEGHRLFADSADATGQRAVFLEEGSVFAYDLRDAPREISCSGADDSDLKCSAMAPLPQGDVLPEISLCTGTNLRTEGDNAIWCQQESWKVESLVSSFSTTGLGAVTPSAMALGRDGELYIADRAGHRVWKRDVNGNSTVVVGTGSKGLTPLSPFAEDSPAPNAILLDEPQGVAMGPEGELYIADTNNHRVLKLQNGQISRYAGTEVAGAADGATLLGTATTPPTPPRAEDAQLNGPTGLAVDARGTLYIADTGNGRVRRVFQWRGQPYVAGQEEPSGAGVESLLEGLSTPRGVAVDRRGHVYVAETGAHRVRRVAATLQLFEVWRRTDGDPTPKPSSYYLQYEPLRDENQVIISTLIAGSGDSGVPNDGGAALSSPLLAPAGMYAAGDHVYLVDEGSQRIYRVELTGQKRIHTVIGGGTSNTPSTPREVALASPVALLRGKTGGLMVLQAQGEHLLSVAADDDARRVYLARRVQDDWRYGPVSDVAPECGTAGTCSQPVVTATQWAFAAAPAGAGQASRLMWGEIGTTTTGVRSLTGTGGVALTDVSVQDASDDRVVLRGNQSGYAGSDDLFLASLRTGDWRPLTDDLVPASPASLDGTRILSRSTLRGEQVLYDVSRLRWLEAGRDFLFAPVTAGAEGLAAWATIEVEKIGDTTQWPFRLTVAKRTALGPDGRERGYPLRQARCGENFAFTPEDSSARAHDVGPGDLVSWLEDPSPDVQSFRPYPPFDLQVARFIDSADDVPGDGARDEAKPSASCEEFATFSNAGPVFALARDDLAGTWVGFRNDDNAILDANALCQGDLDVRYLGVPRYSFSRGGPEELMTHEVAAPTDPAPIRKISVAHTKLDNAQQRTAYVMYATGCGKHDAQQLHLWTLTQTASSATSVNVRRIDPFALGGDIDDVPLSEGMIAVVDEQPTLVFGVRECGGGCMEPPGLYVCRLNVSQEALVVCEGDPLFLGVPGPALMEQAPITNAGKVAFLSDEADLDEVILYDVRTRRRTFATPVEPAVGDRSNPYLSGDSLVYLDYSTGGLAVFELVLTP